MKTVLFLSLSLLNVSPICLFTESSEAVSVEEIVSEDVIEAPNDGIELCIWEDFIE